MNVDEIREIESKIIKNSKKYHLLFGRSVCREAKKLPKP